jgi:hypothetical protein
MFADKVRAFLQEVEATDLTNTLAYNDTNVLSTEKSLIVQNPML